MVRLEARDDDLLAGRPQAVDADFLPFEVWHEHEGHGKVVAPDDRARHVPRKLHAGLAAHVARAQKRIVDDAEGLGSLVLREFEADAPAVRPQRLVGGAEFLVRAGDEMRGHEGGVTRLEEGVRRRLVVEEPHDLIIAADGELRARRKKFLTIVREQRQGAAREEDVDMMRLAEFQAILHILFGDGKRRLRVPLVGNETIECIGIGA